MKYFKTKKINKKNKIIIVLIMIFILDIIMFFNINKTLNENITYLAEVKIEEMTRTYLNKTIKNYLNIDTNDYIKLNLVNNNIVSIDIDNTKTNKLLKDFLTELENNLKELDNGNINNYKNTEFIYGKNGIVFLIPLGIAYNTSLLSGIGPKIPFKVSFLESIETYIDVVVENYGLNNSLIKIYLITNINEVIDMPVNKDRQSIKYKFLISSKLVKGEIPSLYGETISKSSNIVN